MHSSYVETEPCGSRLAKDAVADAREFMSERPFAFDARDLAAAASHTGRLISFENLTVAVGAHLASGLAAKKTKQGHG
jgi:hypothetical protein